MLPTRMRRSPRHSPWSEVAFRMAVAVRAFVCLRSSVVLRLFTLQTFCVLSIRLLSVFSLPEHTSAERQSATQLSNAMLAA